MYGKMSPYPSATPFDRFIKYADCDANLSQISSKKDDCIIADPSTVIDDINFARNTAVLRYDMYEYLFGGEHSVICGEPGDPCGLGASLVRRPIGTSAFDRKIDVVLDGFHDGCVDRRKKVTHCEFDGRWSLTLRKSFIYPKLHNNISSSQARRFLFEDDDDHKKELLTGDTGMIFPTPPHQRHHSRHHRHGHQQQNLRWTHFSAQQASERIMVYGRANLNPVKGGRWTVAASINATEFAQAVEAQSRPAFKKFHLIEFADYDKVFYGYSRFSHYLHRINKMAATGSKDINIYYFAVNPNPVDNGTSLLAVYPIVLGEGRHTAFIGLSLSCDGYHFSSPYPIINSTKATMGPGGGRGMDHPVDGLVTLSKDLGGHTILYEHINVRGIAPSRDPSGQFFDVPPHIVAHIIPRASLARFTARAKAHLRRHYTNQRPGAACLLHQSSSHENSQLVTPPVDLRR
eukprot:CAMPEP_0197307432 /NCGR_PEP_ID=MMETSP0891-20130614/5094_1 /TAXON_ID=44058 ORGANISM="Aureoumbra lagunensis, Strain CCMP1510" /NCGR_SAMPLE_ID=MMETSP0891 /ASSEMBLY_ACC=CAM_ASM_000534 /LENGTH=459 /DNA_ID=CAMNT_0042790769 /DNA_START=405 /DNA_END=1784 /DNA_ORIENTATION=-